MNASAIIAQYVKLANEVAIKEVERLARKTMRDNPEIEEFCMAMGSATFHLDPEFQEEPGENGFPQDNFGQLEHNDPRAKEFYDFLDEWNDMFHINGTPMKIKGANGKLVTDW